MSAYVLQFLYCNKRSYVSSIRREKVTLMFGYRREICRHKTYRSRANIYIRIAFDG